MVRDLFIDPLLRQTRRLVLIFVSLAVLAAAQTLFLFLIKGFLQVLFVHASVPGDVPIASLLPSAVLPYFPAVNSWTMDSASLIVWVPVIMLLAGLAKAVAGFGYTLNQQALALYFGSNFREKMFEAILELPWFENRKMSAGQWMSVIMNDVLFLQNRLADMLTCFIRGGVLVAACLFAMLMIHWPTGVVLVAIAPIGAFVMGKTGKRIAWFAEKFQRELSRMAAAVLDLRNRFDLIRSQSAEQVEYERFDAVNSEYYSVMRKSILIRSAFAPALELIGFIVFAFVMILVHRNYLGSDFSGETLVQFFAALGLMLKPLKEIGEQISRMAETSGVMRQSLGTFAGVQRAAQEKQQNATPIEPILDDLIIKEISAGFLGKPQFRATDIKLRLGKSVAVVGPSGSGKSTLIRTLGGLLPPISWNANVSWESVAHSTSMVSQDPYLFDESLRANLSYGQSQVDENEIWDALTAVNLSADIRERDEGLDGIVNPTQGNLSGGQIQRLVVARSILRKGSVWLFDEATSAVDAASERDIIERVTEIAHMEKKALIYVTHRMQWLHLFDEVYFVEAGAIKLRGTYQELIREPRFAQFVAHVEAGINDE